MRISTISTISTSSTSTGTTASVHRVRNCHDPRRPWCVRWRTPMMAAEAYWYYGTEGEAVRVAATLTQRYRPLDAQEDQDHD